MLEYYMLPPIFSQDYFASSEVFADNGEEQQASTYINLAQI
jgi:hypothetical protein